MHQTTEAWHGYNEKIFSRHLERLAVVYVRQSTMQQGLDHQTSTQLQYGLVHRAVALGWSEKRVVVIDDDLGQSGTSVEGRQGFQRLVAEVGLDHVGLVLGLDMSRLARSSKDWHQLLEICALFGTLLADLDGIYDPSHYNDRLLLGLKGTMSEAEIHMLKQRMYQGKLHKARQGALRFPVPIGYVRAPDGEVDFDPDAQVQHVVRLIFRKFDEIGTLHGVLRYLVQHDVAIGVRERAGAAKGTLVWRRPNRMTLQNVLKNPIYAGAYAYGRRQVDARYKQPGRPSTGRMTRAPQDYHVLLPDHMPAYITWVQHERNVARLAANRAHADAQGAVRQGASLLSGLLGCGKCGRRMQVRYGGVNKVPGYMCHRGASDYGDNLGQYIPSEPIDAFVSHWVLQALEPAALTLSLEATARVEQERHALDQLWRQRVERAASEAERAARHYRLVEPENRLVARHLAQDWEEKLTAQRQVQEEYQRFVHAQPQVLSQAERDAIQQLAQNIPALWHAPTTTMSERKEIVRQIIQRVRVATADKSERLTITIEWMGGGTTTGDTTRPISRLENLHDYPQLCERMRTLVADGYHTAQITDVLNQEGFRSPRRRAPFTDEAIRTLRRRLGLSTHHVRYHPFLQRHEWGISELAGALDISPSTVYLWRKRGVVQARWDHKLKRWVVQADEAELDRLKVYSRQSVGAKNRQEWLDAQASPAPSALEAMSLAPCGHRAEAQMGFGSRTTLRNP
jgi:DNA invertase Pin-like site-specific DNA recombinase